MTFFTQGGLLGDYFKQIETNQGWVRQCTSEVALEKSKFEPFSARAIYASCHNCATYHLMLDEEAQKSTKLLFLVS